jgi:hypothetical protein
MHPTIEVALLVFLALRSIIIWAMSDNHMRAMLREWLEYHKHQFLHRMMLPTPCKSKALPRLKSGVESIEMSIYLRPEEMI